MNRDRIFFIIKKVFQWTFFADVYIFLRIGEEWKIHEQYILNLMNADNQSFISDKVHHIIAFFPVDW